MSTRSVELRMPSAADLARKCETDHKAALEMMWALEDEYHRQDADDIVFSESDVAKWRNALRAVAATLALSQSAFTSLAEDSQ